MLARARQVASKNLHTFAFGKASPIYAYGSGRHLVQAESSAKLVWALLKRSRDCPKEFFSPPLQAPPSHSAVALQPIPLRSIRCSQRACCLVFFCQAFAQSSSAATPAPQTPIRFRYAQKCINGVQPPLIVVLACWSLGLIGLS